MKNVPLFHITRKGIHQLADGDEVKSNHRFSDPLKDSKVVKVNGYDEYFLVDKKDNNTIIKIIDDTGNTTYLAIPFIFSNALLKKTDNSELYKEFIKFRENQKEMQALDDAEYNELVDRYNELAKAHLEMQKGLDHINSLTPIKRATELNKIKTLSDLKLSKVIGLDDVNDKKGKNNQIL